MKQVPVLPTRLASMAAFRKLFAVCACLFCLAQLNACGQTGPLTLPAQTDTGTTGDDDERDDD